MANFDNSDYTLEAAGRKQVATPDHAHGVYAMSRTVAVTTGLAINDLLRFGYLPKGAKIVDAKLVSDDLDSGSAAITLDVGDAGSAVRIFSASLAAQAGVTDVKPVVGIYGYIYTAKTLIYGTVHAAAATPVAGNVTLILLYKMDGEAASY